MGGSLRDLERERVGGTGREEERKREEETKRGRERKGGRDEERKREEGRKREEERKRGTEVRENEGERERRGSLSKGSQERAEERELKRRARSLNQAFLFLFHRPGLLSFSHPPRLLSPAFSWGSYRVIRILRFLLSPSTRAERRREASARGGERESVCNAPLGTSRT